MPLRYSAAASYCVPDMLGAAPPPPPPPPGGLARRAEDAPNAAAASNRRRLRWIVMTRSSPVERRMPHDSRVGEWRIVTGGFNPLPCREGGGWSAPPPAPH